MANRKYCLTPPPKRFDPSCRRFQLIADWKRIFEKESFVTFTTFTNPNNNKASVRTIRKAFFDLRSPHTGQYLCFSPTWYPPSDIQNIHSQSMYLRVSNVHHVNWSTIGRAVASKTRETGLESSHLYKRTSIFCQIYIGRKEKRKEKVDQ